MSWQRFLRLGRLQIAVATELLRDGVASHKRTDNQIWSTHKHALNSKYIIFRLESIKLHILPTYIFVKFVRFLPNYVYFDTCLYQTHLNRPCCIALPP
jgi:hypothetical protein